MPEPSYGLSWWSLCPAARPQGSGAQRRWRLSSSSCPPGGSMAQPSGALPQPVRPGVSIPQEVALHFCAALCGLQCSLPSPNHPLGPCSHKGGRRCSTCLVPPWQRSQPLDTRGAPGADGKVISGALWHPGPICAHTQQLTIPLAAPEAVGRQISYLSWLEKLRKFH